MLPLEIKKLIEKDDSYFINQDKKFFQLPKYDPLNHYKDLTKSQYFKALIILRSYIKMATDYFWNRIQEAKNIDLFMMTPSVSSPTAPGSDSEAVAIKFGKLNTYLTDSAQFGLEPLLLNGFKKVYCYLPSIRGGNFDKRHLNQFFHCEAEMVGKLNELIPLIEDYIKFLIESILIMVNITDKISVAPKKTRRQLLAIIRTKKFPEISFDEAVDLLIKNNRKKSINFTNNGRDITSQGEIELAKIGKFKTPFWIKYYDRNRVPFYQKPISNNSNKVINADLIFPPLFKNGFGGEIVGAGQRQDKPKEIYESLRRQRLSSKPYEWYINLRKLNDYKISCGFGLGVERFIAWILAQDDIKDVIIYPRLKNIRTFP